MDLSIAHPSSNGDSPYRSLCHDQIRILVLKAGLPELPLEASLRAVSLGELSGRPYNTRDCAGADEAQVEPAHFEAISYCWGEPVFSRSIAFAEGGEISITGSLHSALQAFRYPDRSRSLWADAICINQDNLAERSSQVELMGDIFTKASRVLVWLGEPLSCGSDTLAFATLNLPVTAQGNKLRKHLLALLQQHLLEMKICACCNEAIPQSIPISLATALSAIAKLLERPFFTRLWIVQEIVFAQAVEVYCGSHHATWDVFTALSRVPGQYQQENDHRNTATISRLALRQVWAQCKLCNYLNQLRSRHHQRRSDIFRPTELCKDLLMMSYLQCHLPHDRIFAVSRVLGLRDVSGLRADYSLSVAEIYRRVADVYVTAQANRSGGHAALLLALVSTESTQTKTLGRPSWVPDLQHLTRRSRAKNIYYQWAFAKRQFYADSARFRCYISSENSQELCVVGRCFDEITEILKDSQCPSKHVHRRPGSKCPSEEGMQLIRWHARCRAFLKQRAYVDSRSADSEEAKLDAVFSCDKVKDGAFLDEDTISQWLAMMPDSENHLDIRLIYQQLKLYITGYPLDRDRVLCTADCNSHTKAGWVPSSAKVGDRLCQFVGSPYPFVIRARDDGSFSLLGDAFLAEMSEPEALGMNYAEWKSMVDRIQGCDASLKAWMQSEDRIAMKSQHRDTDLSRLDERMKLARQDSIDLLKGLYQSSDSNHDWIRLR